MTGRGRKRGQKTRPKINLTKRVLDGLPPVDRPTMFRDSQMRGFGAIKHPSGKISFYIQYTIDGRQRRMTVGTYGPLMVEQARKQAQKLLGMAETGIDPAEARRAKREEPTLNEWAEEYLSRKRHELKHPRMVEYYLGLARERLGRKKLSAITSTDVSALLHGLADRGKTNATANQAFAALRGCLNDAIRHGVIHHNPAAKIKKLPDPKPRDRVLSDDEMARLLAAIENDPDPFVRAAFTILIETGCRLGELLNARWDDFDLDQGIWKLPETKAGRTQYIPLPSPLVILLRTLPRAGDYVIPGRYPGKPRNDGLKKPWARLRAEAGLPDARIHDLRRTFGLRVARKHGLHVASKLLRHSSTAVTESHYAPLGIEPLREAIEQHAAEVIPMRRKEGEE